MSATDGLAVDEAPWEPGRWWRVIAPDGSLWAETSSEGEARERVRPGDTLQRLYVKNDERWQDVAALATPTEPSETS